MSALRTGAEPDEKPAEQPEAPPQAADVKGIISVTQSRVSKILTETEAAAADIVQAANAESERIVRDTHAQAEEMAKSKVAKIEAVTNRLLAKANGIADEIEGLSKLVDSSIESLAQELGVNERPVAAPTPPTTPAEPAPEAVAEPNGNGHHEETDKDGQHGRSGMGGLLQRMRASNKRDASDGVKLLATQMIAAGHTWEEARVRLSEEFGVKDPTIALDAVYQDRAVAN
jgi:hypothetical protein